MAGEVQVASTWLYGRLAGDGALLALVGGLANPRIYLDVVPAEQPLPAVVFSQQSGTDLQLPGPTRVWNSMLWQVKGIAEGRSLTPLTAIADRIDALLQAASGTAAGGQVHACTRQETVSYLEEDQGTLYRHVGGMYRLLTTAAPAA